MSKLKKAGAWVLLQWRGGSPQELCRRSTWEEADDVRKAAPQEPGLRFTIEDEDSWMRNRPGSA